MAATGGDVAAVSRGCSASASSKTGARPAGVFTASLVLAGGIDGGRGVDRHRESSRWRSRRSHNASAQVERPVACRPAASRSETVVAAAPKGRSSRRPKHRVPAANRAWQPTRKAIADDAADERASAGRCAARRLLHRRDEVRGFRQHRRRSPDRAQSSRRHARLRARGFAPRASSRTRKNDRHEDPGRHARVHRADSRHGLRRYPPTK